MTITFPGESAEYRAARDRLLEREVELRRAMEAVAVARRELPPGGASRRTTSSRVSGRMAAATDVRLSELFAPGKDSLVIYNFMFPRTYGGDRPGPASGKTASTARWRRAPAPPAWPCSISSTAPPFTRLSTSISRSCAKAPLERVLTCRRGARLAAPATPVLRQQHLQPRLPRRDRGRIADADAQRLSPRRRDDPPLLGRRAHLRAEDPGQDHRSVGTLEPLWNLFDLTPGGAP